MNLKELLTHAPAIETTTVQLPSFGVSVRIRKWMADDGIAWQKFATSLNGDTRLFRASVVAASVVDDEGKPLFDLNGDVETIQATWPHADLMAAYEVASTFNRVGGSTEDDEKNSPAIQSESSG